MHKHGGEKDHLLTFVGSLPDSGGPIPDTAPSEMEHGEPGGLHPLDRAFKEHPDRVASMDSAPPVGFEGLAARYGNPDPFDRPVNALHFDTGKPKLDLLDPYAMEQVGHVLAYGGGKYRDPFNYRKGLPYRKLIGSTLRHVFAFLRREDKDPESGLPHLAHAMADLMMLLALTQLHPELDDRAEVSR